MNDSIDYVALVEQHMKDEEMARRLQAEENTNRLAPIAESPNARPTTRPPIERDFIDLTDDFEG